MIESIQTWPQAFAVAAVALSIAAVLVAAFRSMS